MKKDKFTKEQLEAIKIVDNLYGLREDTNKALDYFRSKVKDTNIRCNIKRNEDVSNLHFQHSLPALFCDLISMIDKGDLIFKDA
jgi:anion-transporting  ArsA/GET3 family ATPase